MTPASTPNSSPYSVRPETPKSMCTVYALDTEAGHTEAEHIPEREEIKKKYVCCCCSSWG